jgi:hypothetical protein
MQGHLKLGDGKLGLLGLTADFAEAGREVIRMQDGHLGFVSIVFASSAQFEQHLLGLLAKVSMVGALLQQSCSTFVEAFGKAGNFGAADLGVGLKHSDLDATIAGLLGMPGKVKLHEAMVEAAVAKRLGGLAKELGDLPADFPDNIGDGHQIGIDTAQLNESLTSLGFIACSVGEG